MLMGIWRSGVLSRVLTWTVVLGAIASAARHEQRVINHPRRGVAGSSARSTRGDSDAGALGVGGGDLRDGKAPLNHRLDLPFRHQGTDLLELLALGFNANEAGVLHDESRPCGSGSRLVDEEVPSLRRHVPWVSRDSLVGAIQRYDSALAETTNSTPEPQQLRVADESYQGSTVRGIRQRGDPFLQPTAFSHRESSVHTCLRQQEEPTDLIDRAQPAWAPW